MYAIALATKATISNVSIALCVLFSPRELLKKSRPSTSKQSKETGNCSLLPAKRLLIFNRSEPVSSTVSTRTETNFTLNVLLEDASGNEDVCILTAETNEKNQNIPHDLHNITHQPYPLLELWVKDTSVMLSTLQNYYCLLLLVQRAFGTRDGEKLLQSLYFFASSPPLY